MVERDESPESPPGGPATRVSTDAWVGYSGARLEGEGVVKDVSRSGARISAATTPVTNGTELKLAFGLGCGVEPGCLSAEVVRQTQDGFAVRFVKLERAGAALLDQLLDQLTETTDDPPSASPSKQAIGRVQVERTISPLKVSFRAGERRGGGQVMNLDEEGLFVSAEHPPEVGERVRVVFSDHSIEVEGVVRWRTVRGSPTGFGIEIHQPSHPYLALCRDGEVDPDEPAESLYDFDIDEEIEE